MKERIMSVLGRISIFVLGLGLFWLTWWLAKTGLALADEVYGKTFLEITYGEKIIARNLGVYVIAVIATVAGGICCLYHAFRPKHQPRSWRRRVRTDLNQ